MGYLVTRLQMRGAYAYSNLQTITVLKTLCKHGGVRVYMAYGSLWCIHWEHKIYSSYFYGLSSTFLKLWYNKAPITMTTALKSTQIYFNLLFQPANPQNHRDSIWGRDTLVLNPCTKLTDKCQSALLLLPILDITNAHLVKIR